MTSYDVYIVQSMFNDTRNDMESRQARCFGVNMAVIMELELYGFMRGDTKILRRSNYDHKVFLFSLP